LVCAFPGTIHHIQTTAIITIQTLCQPRRTNFWKF
jgi:hypothetical protein